VVLVAKPSIFSNDYRRKVRIKRRRRIIICFLMIILIVVVIYKGNITSNVKYLVNNIKAFSSDKTQEKDKVAKDEDSKLKQETNNEKSDVESEKTQEVSKVKEENIQVKLPDDNTVTMVVKQKDNVKYIKDIISEANFQRTVNDSGKSSVVIDNKQNMYLIDVNQNIENITNKDYISSDGTVYNKDAQLKIRPDFLWDSSPAYINENLVVYISELPWFNRQYQYLWIYDIQNKKHTFINNYKGKEIKFKGLTDKGFEIDIDDTVIYMNQDGQI
jgi:hypothetical protein